MIRPVLLILVPALALPIMSYRIISGDNGTANAALARGAVEAMVPPVPKAPVFGMKDEASYSVVLDRPLFTPSRRPTQATAAAAPSSTGLALLGVVAAKGRQVALIRTAEGSPSVRAELGQDVAGWKLTRMAPTQVQLERHGGKLTLGLQFKSPGGAATAAVAPAAAAPAAAAPPASDDNGQQADPPPLTDETANTQS
jgi:hypothetical protein